MASDKRIAANRRNAAKSTGPRTHAGKGRSRMNALRHGLASSLEQGISEAKMDLEALVKRSALIEHERAEITFVIEEKLFHGKAQDLEDDVRRLTALDRYTARCSSAMRKK